MRKNGRQIISLTEEKDMAERLNEIAGKMGMSRAQLIRRLIHDALEDGANKPASSVEIFDMCNLMQEYREDVPKEFYGKMESHIAKLIHFGK